jgi:hypothetical protein
MNQKELIDVTVTDAFNAAICHIQTTLGVTDGGFASHWWSGKDAAIESQLREYMHAEIESQKRYAQERKIESAEKMFNALKVITETPNIVAYLEKNDPKSIEQARDAIGKKTAMTLSQFVATRKHVDSIGDAIGQNELKGLAGFLYLDQLYIFYPTEKVKSFHTITENSEPEGSLEEVEKHLYEFAMSAGYKL